MIRASELPVTWFKSSRSNNGAANCVELGRLRPEWRKSSWSQNGANNCVEVACLSAATAVRDSKEPDGPALVFSSSAFGGFLGAIRAGRFSG